MGERLEPKRIVPGWSRSLWRTLGSRRLSVLLLAALLLVAVLASLFPQMPPASEARAAWLQAAALRYGPAIGLLRSMGLFERSCSPLVLGLLAALAANCTACTIQRLPGAWHSLARPPDIAPSAAFYTGHTHHTTWPVTSLQAGLAASESTLRQHGYHPRIEHDDGSSCTHLNAQRGRWSPVGTIVSHCGAVVLVIAVALRPALSWQEKDLALLPGRIYSVSRGDGLSIRAASATLEPQSNISPGEVSVALTVAKGTAPTVQRTVRTNRPLTAHGLTFHLTSYGPAAQIVAPEGTFDIFLDGPEAQAVTLPKAGITLNIAYAGTGEALFVEALAPGGRLFGAGRVTDGQTVEIEGIPISFRLTSYTEWQVGHDPTFGIAVGSASLLLVGAMISLWVRQRRLWIRIDDEELRIAGAGDWGEEFDWLAAEMRATTRARGGPGG